MAQERGPAAGGQGARATGGSAASGPQEPWNFEGEYALYAGLAPGGLDVRWITNDSVSGVVRARVGGEVVDERTTSAGTVHAARLEAAGDLVAIEYGAVGAEELHRTEIWMTPLPPETDLVPPDSVFIFGDAHGEYHRVVTLLERAGLVDGDSGKWVGGAAVVVMLGDIVDRGEYVTRLLWFLYGLERQARSAGGRVLTLLGNHEVMVMSGDLRYVSQREATIGRVYRMPYAELFDPTVSILGRWLASKPGLVRLGDLLLAHGGVSPEYRNYSLADYQDSLQAFMAEPPFRNWHNPGLLQKFVEDTDLTTRELRHRYDFFFSPQSVFWYRDLVLADTLDSHLEKVLAHFDVSVHVVAHTPVQTIQERYHGSLIAVDLLDAAAEMLLLTRGSDGDWEKSKISVEGWERSLEGG